jgi:hypothetical protein
LPAQTPQSSHQLRKSDWYYNETGLW